MCWRWVARRRTRGERGAAAVEFGLLAPLLILLVFGIIEFGMMLNRDMMVASIARDGARTASLGGNFADTCAAMTAEVPVRQPAEPVNCTTADSLAAAGKWVIVINCIKSDGTACHATSATNFDALNGAGATALVKVSYGYTWVTPVISSVMGNSTSLHSASQMVVE